jgi:hypothetical protein
LNIQKVLLLLYSTYVKMFFSFILSSFCLDLAQMAYLLNKIITQDMYVLQRVLSHICPKLP